ncbi:hypothetical protein TSTA_124700 [Talaromyces stipitatus ATCC 10500]|uniref:Uncharacterized protein n=1 Tax=Talaromyces stipitatus (strain ATCC 10500 / CBS 375.48 / QM 6759 / NRRL 1006) TaxID=441959 RepID=B8MB50_TALSN|nr:uncharacterized protein TSTA_124700 [Talaromyces stipitatus ATCC 10500]EED18751.1 hypothetical protein TSTA_124700 [Talaromyces stipitatus ATCC 10500]
MLSDPNPYEITFVTPSRKDNGILKLHLGEVHTSLPIRLTVPRHSSATLPVNKHSRVSVTRFAAKVHYGANFDSEGFREITRSHMNKWVRFKEDLSSTLGHDGRKKQLYNGSMLMRSSTLKTGIVEVKNVVFYVPGVYKIAFELQFESGELAGRTPWQTVEVQRVRKTAS